MRAVFPLLAFLLGAGSALAAAPQEPPSQKPSEETPPLIEEVEAPKMQDQASAPGFLRPRAEGVPDIRDLWAGPGNMPEDSLFEEALAYEEDAQFITEPILPGEALPALLQRMKLSDADAAAVATAFLAEARVDPLPEQTSVRLKFYPNVATPAQVASGGYVRGLEEMEILLPPNRLVTVKREDEQFIGSTRIVDIERRFVAAAGEINVSLFAAALGAGVPREVMIRFADIFAFDVDFSRAIRRGDRFELVYEMQYDQEGREIGPGEIVFAALTWSAGEDSRAYYLFAPEEEEGRYFAGNGRNPRTQLMKAPINGARVTSRFGNRMHPVLGYTRAHRGVDFGAPRGPPVMATGDGEISIASPRGSFGNYIEIEHSGDYQTVYAHLNGFAAGIKKGVIVKQGQVIGYVGSTGRSTGPHLHYEVRQEGEPQNPETVKVAVGETLIGEEKSRFEERRDQADLLRIKPFAVAEATLP
ncbi:MAG: M23 family metallopeptidase [Pseudomonadota bacterium]